MMQGFESVEQELSAKRLQLEQELASVREHATSIEADLERVHEALAALTGHKKKSRSRSRSKKPVPTLQELQQHITDVRNESPYANAAALERAVRAKVKNGGSSLKGFKPLFNEALLTSPGNEPNEFHHSSSRSDQVHQHSVQDSFENDDGSFVS